MAKGFSVHMQDHPSKTNQALLTALQRGVPLVRRPWSVMAQTLGIKGATVSNHIEHILGKLGVHSRLEAVVYAKERGLV